MFTDNNSICNLYFVGKQTNVKSNLSINEKYKYFYKLKPSQVWKTKSLSTNHINRLLFTRLVVVFKMKKFSSSRRFVLQKTWDVMPVRQV
jgi:hypothetical protein